MPLALLTKALQRAESRDPSVAAATVLHGARVMTRFDQAEADRLLDRGLARLASLPDPDRAAIAVQTRALTATVSPRRAFDASAFAFADPNAGAGCEAADKSVPRPRRPLQPEARHPHK